MFAVVGTHVSAVQSVLPASHLASVLSSNIHALPQTVSDLARGWRSHSRKVSSKSRTEEHTETTATGVQLKDLGLEDLDTNIDLRVLCPLLNPLSAKITDRHNHWKPHNASTHSYFENKYGFSESKLHENPPPLQRHSVTVDLTSLHTKWIPRSFLFQQTRGFKSRRMERKSESEIMHFRESLFGKLDGSKKDHSQKLKSMLSESEQNSQVQDKLKIAFAEGYSANSGEGNKKKFSRAWVFWIVLSLVVAFYIRDAISTFSKELKFNVVSGDKFEIDPEQINVTFEDVKGADEAKAELQDVVEFLKDPEKFKALGAKLPKGVLLVGRPGTGKTLLARAVAGEAGVPFFHASGSEFDEVFVGTGARRVRSLFGAAKKRAPCVVFLDEIDTVGAKRSNSQLHPYANQTINQLLSEMDGFHQNQGIIVLGATNKRANLDKALIRPGRFDVEVKVMPPDLKGRRDILQLYLSKIKLGSDIDIDVLARTTMGCTGADLESVVNQAALKGALEGSDEVNMSHVEFAKDKVLMGPAKKHRIPDEEENLNTAYHEAGHTIVAYFTKNAKPVHKVTIIQRGAALGLTMFMPEKDMYKETKAELLARMDAAMGGRIAEELIFGSDKVTTGASSDFQIATTIATQMVKRFGMSDKFGVRVADRSMSQSMSEQADQEVKRLLQESYERSRALLKLHSTELNALAQALMKYETLDAEDIKTIMEGKTLDKKL